MLVGRYIRLKIEVTPVFRDVLDAKAPVQVPVRDALVAQWRQVLLVGGMLSAPEWGSASIGYYLAGLAAISTLCALALPETRSADLAAQPPVGRGRSVAPA
ncbi:MAG: hypothetical protein ACT4QG_10060 [Sporichthyaceae bacterium]